MPPSTTRYVSLYKSQTETRSRTRWSLKRQRPMSVTSLNTKTIKLPTGEQTVCLPTTIHCYLLTHCLKDGPVAAVIMANIVANVASPMNGATVPHMAKLAIGAKASIISKLSVVPRLQPRQDRARTEARSHSRLDMVPRGATMAKAKEVVTVNTRRRRRLRSRRRQNAYAVTMKNSVPSEVTTTSGGEREKQGNVSSKTVPSGPEEEGTYNRFSCFAVHSKMSQSTNAKSKPMEGLYTDTDPDNRSEIITDVTIRMPGKAGTMMMEVKVDPGAQPSCIPLHKFKTLFPHLCRDGLPKEGLLDNTHNEFQSYIGGEMTCYGHLLIDVKDKITKKYHPIRFYVMNTDVPRILISHAASFWLGLVRVLCDNKAPRIKRQVASIDKKSDFQAKSGHFRTSTSNSASSSQKKQTTPKTVTSGASNIPSPRMHSFEDAKLQTRKKATGVRPGRDVDVSDGEQHSQDEASATTGKEPKTSKQGNSVHSGPNKKIMDRVKDSPFSNKTGNNSNAKHGPKMKDTSKKAPRRRYYRPSNDDKTFQINNKGHLQCLQDPKLIHKPNDKGKLPGSREAPIYHEPGTVSCKTVEDFEETIP